MLPAQDMTLMKTVKYDVFTQHMTRKLSAVTHLTEEKLKAQFTGYRQRKMYLAKSDFMKDFSISEGVKYFRGKDVDSFLQLLTSLINITHQQRPIMIIL